MRAPCRGKGRSRGNTSEIATILDALALHVGNLGEHGNDEFAHTPANWPEAHHIDDDTALDQCSDGSLNVQRVTSKAVYG